MRSEERWFDKLPTEIFNQLHNKLPNDYDKSSFRERIFFLELLKNSTIFKDYDYKATPISGYQKYDFYLKHKTEDKNLIIEIKVRDLPFDKLMNTLLSGFILEKNKYKEMTHLRLLNKMTHLNCRLLYINFTSNGVYIFDLDKVALKEKYIERKAFTMGYDDNNTKQYSSYLLNVDDGKKLEYRFENSIIKNYIK